MEESLSDCVRLRTRRRFFVYCTDTKLIRKVFFTPEKFTLFLTLGTCRTAGREDRVDVGKKQPSVFLVPVPSQRFANPSFLGCGAE